MELSELQKLIIGGLKICGLDYIQIMAVFCKLHTEEQQWKMAEYLDSVVDNPPSFEEIYQKAKEIKNHTT